MPYRFFFVPISDQADVAGELNRFVSSHRTVAVERNFLPDGASSGWAVCVTYTDSPSPEAKPLASNARREEPDWRSMLTPAEFAVFSRMRALRAELAKADGVPPYNVFTNEHFKEMVRQRASSLAALKRIARIGDARAEKYGPTFLKIIAEADLPAGETPSDAPP